MRPHKLGVQVRQQGVACVHGAPNDGGVWLAKHVRLLRVHSNGIVVAVKRVKCAKLHPACAQFRGCFAIEAAGVWANHGNAKGVHHEDAGNGKINVIPGGGVVAQPVMAPGAAR